MPARTYGQHATPTTWGAVLAQWGNPLMDAADALSAVRKSSLLVSLAGASGTASALGADPAGLRAALAEGLGLQDPKRNWHTDRGPILRIADWMASVVTALSAMGQTLIGLSASGISEVRFNAAGASSTMPQKQNPVAASALLALGHQMTGLRASLGTAGTHQHQRDGAAWFTEWMVLPQIALTTASALQIAKGLSQNIAPDVEQMQTASAGLGLMLAETLSFALAENMPRPEAQAIVKELCQRAISENAPLPDLARTRYPNLAPDVFDVTRQTGDAPKEARTFAARARRL
jgi:3-carboxy-cis,cis-muconate cycloisomerase